MSASPKASSKRDCVEQDTKRRTRPFKRRRTPFACEECRVRKRRCDGDVPACGGCVRRLSTCTYESEIRGKEWHTSTIQALRAQLHQLESAGSSLRPLRDELDSAKRGRDDSIAEEGRRDVRTDLTLANWTQSPGIGLSPQVMSPAPAAAGLEGSRSAGNGQVRSCIGETSPLRSLQPCRFEQLMEPIEQVIAQQEEPPESEKLLPTVYGVQVRSGTEKKSRREDKTTCKCDSILEVVQWRLPMRKRADSLLATYFSRPHRDFPILHERSFLTQYQRLWNFQDGVSDSSECVGLCTQQSQGKLFPAMLNAVFALACMYDMGTSKESLAQADDYFRLTRGIDLMDILHAEVGLEAVQLGLLMASYLQTTERYLTCWNLIDLTTSLAQCLGLHLSFEDARRKTFYKHLVTQVDFEMKSRVWYGCVVLKGEISLAFGRSIPTTSEESRLALPEAIDDDQLGDCRGQWNTQPSDKASWMELYIQRIRLIHILENVLEREDRATSEMIPDLSAILKLDTMLIKWQESLPLQLRSIESAGENGSSEYTSSQSQNSKTMPATRRLYSRFLHVRQLGLRPALTYLFQKRRLRAAHKLGTLEARMQDLLLINIADQCALAAESLVKLIHTHEENNTFLAWWKIVDYLYTCGSTILMARFCTTNESNSLVKTLPANWALCLQCLSRYTGLSSIAKKAFHLLQESENRLASAATHVNDGSSGANSIRPCSNVPKQSSLQLSADKGDSSSNGAFLSSLDNSYATRAAGMASQQDFNADMGPDDNFFDVLSNDTWNAYASGAANTACWPYLPDLWRWELDYIPWETLPLSFQ